MFDLSSAEWTAIGLSLRIAMVATACALPFGIAIGWLLARGTFWGKTGLDGLVHLPLVLPPVVTGYLLLIWFGRSDSRSKASIVVLRMRQQRSAPIRCWSSLPSRCR